MLKKTITISREIHKTIFHRCFPSSLATINKNKSNNESNTPCEDSYVSLQNSYFLLQFNVPHIVAANTQHANNIATFLGNPKLFACFHDKLPLNYSVIH